MSGERGFISYIEKKEILNDFKFMEASLIKKVEELNFKNLLLSDNLDLD